MTGIITSAIIVDRVFGPSLIALNEPLEVNEKCTRKMRTEKKHTSCLLLGPLLVKKISVEGGAISISMASALSSPQSIETGPGRLSTLS